MKHFVTEFFGKASKLTGRIRICVCAKEGTISFDLQKRLFF